ncbi:ferredoxin reductase [Gordonia araii NBRC 100433]|uniref:Ferredoxin reductase n=1 Tax=Gordonia araii NBRC 100433 TaxID=1073574 RepID=G7H0B4_9ACTN|nr:FAD-dependent oxidoreductase [Gordonia araii]NNG96945.1 FAD-dependent oxidoreductase [Gordonia araii NBRC 100433]GAB09289.1 ferredoxin reductase [Gordonia araii NBRC 100433]
MGGSTVIVGGGLAGAKTAEALRERGYDGAIVLLAAESHLPYERPPLSKGYLSGSDDRDSVFVHDRAWYDEHDVDLRVGVTVERIDRDARQVALSDGSAVHYDKVVIATGSRPRRFPGDPDVAYLRTLDDSDALRARFGEGRSLLIVGAGWIGLEAAAAARGAGTAVTIVEPADAPLEKVLGKQQGGVIAELHRRHGVDLRLSTGVERIESGTVTVDGGEELTADTVLVGIGAEPITDVAADAGLVVSNGIDVDAGLRTSDPDFFAVGDVANQDHPLFGRIRVEHWANALNQPAVAAANALGGDETYARLPYFYTDQYEFGMEYRGYASGEDQVVVRGSEDDLEYLAFWLADRVVRAGMNVNIWDRGDDIATLIESQRRVDPARLADPSIPLADV